MRVIIRKQNDIVEYLITKHSNSIDVMAKNKHKWNAYSHAALRNDIDSIKLFTAKDWRKLESRDDFERSINKAPWNNYEFRIQHLLSNGVDSHVRNHKDRTTDLYCENVSERTKKTIRNHQTK